MMLQEDDALAVHAALERLERVRAVEAIWTHHSAVWKPNPEDDVELSNRLGWLDVIGHMVANIPDLEGLVNGARGAGFQDVVLLGMGGSSLCPEVFRRTFAPGPRSPRLHVLDTTVPATVLAVRRKIDPARTLFIVASKSGTTTEVVSLYRYFFAEVEAVRGAMAGDNFVAITDPNTRLARLVRERSFRRSFISWAEIGGRYSALSFFGIVPAALLGIPLLPLLERAKVMAEACRKPEVADNPGLQLGAALGALAERGRDKVTILPAPAIASFGLWAEQLLAESLGKEGFGLVPVVGEPLMGPAAYGNDRVFVSIGALEPDADALLGALAAAGHPVIRLDLAEPLDLGAEFFRWEFATAIAGVVLGINPFNQPNVQESKDATDRTLKQVADSGQPPALATDGSLSGLLAQRREGDYVALMAFLPETPETDALLAELRRAITGSTGLATTVGYGPRFLHSTGQLHKGGSDTALCLQLTADVGEDAAVPQAAYTFGTLAAAQAEGDLQTLRAHGRRAVRVHLGQDIAGGLRTLTAAAGSSQ